MNSNLLQLFRKIAFLEGLSLIALVGICMPLKYIGGMSEAVKEVGWIHGILFILYVLLLAKVWSEYEWPLKRVALALVASLLPFGTIVFDRSLKREAATINGS